jgi:hypothetical protein
MAITKYKMNKLLNNQLLIEKKSAKRNKLSAIKTKQSCEQLLPKKMELGYFALNSEKLSLISKLDHMIKNCEAIESYTFQEDWVMNEKIKQVYRSVIGEIYSFQFNSYEKLNILFDIDEIINELEYEMMIISEMYLNRRTHPARTTKHFFHKINISEWEKALIIGAKVTLLEEANLHKAYYKKIDNKRHSKRLIRLITTSIEYGLNKNETYNYIEKVYELKYSRSRIYLITNKFLTSK